MLEEEIVSLPVLPLRDVVVFPYMVIPLFVGREKSINALNQAVKNHQPVFLVAQKEASFEEPSKQDIYHVGTVANVLQLLTLPDGTVKALVEGVQCAEVVQLLERADVLQAQVKARGVEALSQAKASPLMRTLKTQFEQLVKQGKKISSDALNLIEGVDDADKLAHIIAAQVSLPMERKQEVLEIHETIKRLEYLLAYLEDELDLLQVEKRIRGRVKKQMEKNQREYYLNEQIKAIQKELTGDENDAPTENQVLQQRIEEAQMPAQAKEKTLLELKRLKLMPAMSAEASVLRTYIDWMLSVPWQKRSKISLNMAKAQAILDQDHYGLDEVKERILEYLAVQKRVKKPKGPILCLVGPPGVGKTSLGESIAKATQRQFIRMALGGVRDEAEIRGHRRTYIGSMPGRIVQKISKAGVKNPLILLDEIDKMGMDHRGDPASALLEVLDPEQNQHFNDHYLDMDFDLSEVMFICTANSMDIPSALLDRMEIIRIPGYTEDEKIHIAQRYLLGKQSKNNGLKEGELQVSESAIQSIVRHYTREAGVRGLEREIAKLSRKAVKSLSLNKAVAPVCIDAQNLNDYLGVQKFDFGSAEAEDHIGLVTGLAWTQVGGELLNIEAAAVPGKGLHVKTGSLGDVMQESIQAALTVVRSRAQSLGIRAHDLQTYDLHIHVPEGATPKDGPSAGISMCTAMVSVLTGIAVKSSVAMTGEITLRGQVLRIGGLKEKLLAAQRGNIKTVIIPQDNQRDLADIPANILQALDIKPVKWIDEVLHIALLSMPIPLSDEEYLAGFNVDGAKQAALLGRPSSTH